MQAAKSGLRSRVAQCLLLAVAFTVFAAACDRGGLTLACSQSLATYCAAPTALDAATRIPCVRHVDPLNADLSYCSQVGMSVGYSHYVCTGKEVFGFIVDTEVEPNVGVELIYVYDKRTGELVEVIQARFPGDLGQCLGGPSMTTDQNQCNDDATLTTCGDVTLDAGAGALKE